MATTLLCDMNIDAIICVEQSRKGKEGEQKETTTYSRVSRGEELVAGFFNLISSLPPLNPQPRLQGPVLSFHCPPPSRGTCMRVPCEVLVLGDLRGRRGEGRKASIVQLPLSSCHLARCVRRLKRARRTSFGSFPLAASDGTDSSQVCVVERVVAQTRPRGARGRIEEAERRPFGATGMDPLFHAFPRSPLVALFRVSLTFSRRLCQRTAVDAYGGYRQGVVRR